MKAQVWHIQATKRTAVSSPYEDDIDDDDDVNGISSFFGSNRILM